MIYGKWVTRTLVGLGLTVLAVLTLDVTPSHAQGTVDFVFVNVPGSAVKTGDAFDITIQLQADGQQVSGVAIHLDFDPAVLNVTALTPSGALPMPIGTPAFDNTAGTIDYTAVTFGGFPTGVFDLLTISFQAMGIGTSSIAYSFTFPRLTDVTVIGDSNAQANTSNAQAVVGSPLAVTIGWFLAERAGDEVLFRWQAATETGTAGFHVLAVVDDSVLQLNQELIASTVVDSVTPTNYSVAAETSATQFKLQEVGVNGGLTEHGPFDLGVAYGAYTLPGNVDLTERIWLPLIRR